MHIGGIAKKIGLSADAIRFYERSALLPQAPRTQGGFRVYGENDVKTLAFIQRAKNLGFKLQEIRGLVRLRETRSQPCAPVRQRLEAKLADVRRRIADLRRMEHRLSLELCKCERELRKPNAHCPILREVGDPKMERMTT